MMKIIIKLFRRSPVKISPKDIVVTNSRSFHTGKDSQNSFPPKEKIVKTEFEGSRKAISGVNDQKSHISSSENENGVVREYEVALKYLDFGFFHIILLVINGVALGAGGLQILCISFIFPVLNRKSEWAIGSSDEAILGSIILVGMLFGTYLLGSLGDVLGRRTILVLSLLISALFGFFSAFLPWFWIFVLFRFLSGIG